MSWSWYLFDSFATVVIALWKSSCAKDMWKHRGVDGVEDGLSVVHQGWTQTPGAMMFWTQHLVASIRIVAKIYVAVSVFGCAFQLGSGCSGRGVEWGWQEGVSEVGPVILSSAGLDAKLQNGAAGLHCIGKGPLYVYPLCILTISLVYPSMTF